MDDYSHCHYWNYERQCIGFDCDDCQYKREWEEFEKKQLIDLSEWEELFEL